jgi:hypothetical protein
MILLIIILLIILYKIYDPYIDIFNDYRKEYHVILWYNHKGKRKFINIVGNQ